MYKTLKLSHDDNAESLIQTHRLPVYDMDVKNGKKLALHILIIRYLHKHNIK